MHLSLWGLVAAPLPHCCMSNFVAFLKRSSALPFKQTWIRNFGCRWNQCTVAFLWRESKIYCACPASEVNLFSDPQDVALLVVATLRAVTTLFHHIEFAHTVDAPIDLYYVWVWLWVHTRLTVHFLIVACYDICVDNVSLKSTAAWHRDPPNNVEAISFFMTSVSL